MCPRRMYHNLAEEADEARNPSPLDASSSRESMLKGKAMPTSGRQSSFLGWNDLRDVNGSEESKMFTKVGKTQQSIFH